MSNHQFLLRLMLSCAGLGSPVATPIASVPF
jgi:hypothetical protein